MEYFIWKQKLQLKISNNGKDIHCILFHCRKIEIESIYNNEWN